MKKQLKIGNVYKILDSQQIKLFFDENIQKRIFIVDNSLYINKDAILSDIIRKNNITIIRMYVIETNMNVYFSLARTNDIIDEKYIYPTFFKKHFKQVA